MTQRRWYLASVIQTEKCESCYMYIVRILKCMSFLYSIAPIHQKDSPLHLIAIQVVFTNLYTPSVVSSLNLSKPHSSSLASCLGTNYRAWTTNEVDGIPLVYRDLTQDRHPSLVNASMSRSIRILDDSVVIREYNLR